MKSSTVMRADGNIYISAALRNAVGAKPGQTFDVIAKGNVLVLVPLVDVRTLRGAARGLDTSDYRDK